jgi:hypothetical protein
VARSRAFSETYARLNLELGVPPAEAALTRVCVTALPIPTAPSFSKNADDVVLHLIFPLLNACVPGAAPHGFHDAGFCSTNGAGLPGTIVFPL